MTTEHATAKTLAENMMLRAAHQVFTIVGLPLLVGLVGWTLKTTVEANERLAVMETIKPRVDRLEAMADSHQPAYPMSDGRALEREVGRMDGRVAVLENKTKKFSSNEGN